jgi:hypothetical protein
MHSTSLGFDSDYAYICGEGPELHVFHRDTGRPVWSLAKGRPNLKVPIFLSLTFNQNIDTDVQTRYTADVHHNKKMGGVYRPTKISRKQVADWLGHLFDPPNTGAAAGSRPAPSLVAAWQQVNICEDTKMLVFCCNGVICLLKNYKRFLEDPSRFAVYRIHTAEPLVSQHACAVARILTQESIWLSKSGSVSTSLSV